MQRECDREQESDKKNALKISHIELANVASKE